MNREMPEGLDEVQEKTLLYQVLEHYDCYELLEYIHRIQWLANVKDVLGFIPTSFNLTYEEIGSLVILHEEINKYQKKKSMEIGKDSSPATPRSSTPHLKGRGVTINKFRGFPST